MYDFAVVALLALATLKLVDFLTDAVPQLAEAALAAHVRDRGRRDRVARLLGVPGVGHRHSQRDRRDVEHRIHRGRPDRAVAGALRVPHARPGNGRRDAGRARNTDRSRRVSRAGTYERGAAQRCAAPSASLIGCGLGSRLARSCRRLRGRRAGCAARRAGRRRPRGAPRCGRRTRAASRRRPRRRRRSRSRPRRRTRPGPRARAGCPVASSAGPDHSIITEHARGLEPAAQHLGLHPGPFAELDQAAVVVVVERGAARRARARPGSRGTASTSGAVLGAARRAPDGRFVGHGRECTRARSVRCGVSARRIPAASFPSERRRRRFYVETLGCPKNAVDSDKVVASLLADGLVAAVRPVGRRSRRRQHLRVHRGRPPGVDRRRARARRRPSKPGAKLVVTGCMAERYGDELAAALPEADAVVGFAGEGAIADVVLAPAASRSASATCSSCRGPRRARRGPT